MEFNESGELVKMEAPLTSNPFVTEAYRTFVRKFPSVSTFTYSDGLCTEKLEKIAFINERNKTSDTITCVNRYTYNDKGDLISWEYSGGQYWLDLKTRNHYSFPYVSFTIRFEYDYDRYGNWITRRAILPENYEDIRALHIKVGNDKPAPGESPVITTEREIDYHAFSAKEKTELKKKDAPKFTAVQGYGLYGDVKSVSDSRFVILFDEYGNITKRTWIDYEETNEFSYESSTRYMRSGVGPFRITCEGNLRKEEDEGKIMGTEEYEFDKKGRVVRHDYADADGMCPINETYTYNGREKFPVTMVYKYSYEEGQDVATCKYTYIETDKQGNWTKRKVNRTWECVEYFFDGEKDTSRTMTKTDPEFTETRTISYY